MELSFDSFAASDPLDTWFAGPVESKFHSELTMEYNSRSHSGESALENADSEAIFTFPLVEGSEQTHAQHSTRLADSNQNSLNTHDTIAIIPHVESNRPQLSNVAGSSQRLTQSDRITAITTVETLNRPISRSPTGIGESKQTQDIEGKIPCDRVGCSHTSRTRSAWR